MSAWVILPLLPGNTYLVLRGIPSRMSLLLDITPKVLEEIVYFVKWVITDPKDTDLQYKQIIDDREYRELTRKYGYGSSRQRPEESGPNAP